MPSITLQIQTCDNKQYTFDNIQAILFDLDGTLVDTLDLHVHSFQWILSKLGKNVEKDELERLMGMTPQAILQKYLPNLPEEEIWEAAIKKEEYLYRLTDKIEVNDGVKDFLYELGKNGIIRVIISSTHRSLVNRLLNTADLIEILDHMVCGDEITNGKPNPEPYLKGLVKTGLNKTSVIGIGDSIYDGQSLNSAGIRFIGITTGKTDCKTLIKNNFSCIIASFTDLSIIKRLN